MKHKGDMMYKRKGAPIFVKIDEYKDIIDILALMRKKIKEAKGTIERINVLKNEEDSELEAWHQNLDEVERKVDFIDKTLFQPDTF